jgi:ATP adenylyltransferase/5',5'''-P-1,P-4-tetraphosphate phosphorylase II
LDLSVSFNYGKVAGCTIEEHIHVKIEPPAKLSIEDATESLSCPRSVHYPAPAIVLNSVTEATELRQLIANLQQANQAYNLLLRGDRAWIVGRTQLVSTQYLPGVKFASLEIGGLLILDDRRLLKQLNEERISRALEDVSLRMEVLKTFL